MQTRAWAIGARWGVAVLSLSAIAFPAYARQMSTADAATAFGKRESVLDASLSPDGSKVATIVPGPGQGTVLVVTDVASGSSKPINFADGNPLALISCGWASDTRLLCTEYGIATIEGIQRGFLRLASLNADGTDARAVAAQKRGQYWAQGSDGRVIDWRDGSSPKVLIERYYVPVRAAMTRMGNSKRGYGVDLIDVVTGKVDHVVSPNPVARGYIADGTGAVRIMQTDESLRRNTFSKGVQTFYYRKQGSDDWEPFSTYNSVTDEGMAPIAVDGSANVAYAIRRVDGRDALFQVALDGSMKEKLAYADRKYDVSGVITVGRRGHVVAATYSSDIEQAHYFDQKYQELTASLSVVLPNQPLINIVDSSADGTKHLVYAESDVDAGRYFYFDEKAKKLRQIAIERPLLTGVPLGKMTPISYPAADGTMIPAYLTLPPGSDGKNLPAIVMPHGGPASRDEWGFDWLTQFFVNRGYAVLQPNYRGSTGYGDDWFNDNAWHSWKTAIGDVDDAGKWLIAQGIADPERLAIVGWSYGGYAALQSNVLDPDLFHAVVAIAPVTDLGMLRDEHKGYTNTRLALNEIGDGAEIVEAGSPLRHVDAFKAPVLMFHGTKDMNVDVDQSRAMDEALHGAGKKSELVVYPDLDHQLRDSAARIDMLTKAATFLDKNLNR